MRVPIFTIILLLAAEMCGYGYQPAHSVVELQMASISMGLRSFEANYQRYPSSSEGLSVLISRPQSIPQSSWPGPYLSVSPIDFWGRGFVYRYPGIHNTNSYDLYSCGADGVSKSEGSDLDDINNWDKSEPWRAYYNRTEWEHKIKKLVYSFGFPLALLVLVLCVWRKFGRTEKADSAVRAP
jgi:general secretion pathway protein G